MEKIWILLLRLEAPIQSYGERAQWDFRDTAYFPTKSAVIGILAAAMGLKREDAAITSLANHLEVSVRADRPGEIALDFQTAIGIIQKAEGGQRGKKGEKTGIIPERQYLEDASFLVAVLGDYDLLCRCRDALLNPVWAPFLGRKCCVPTRPILEDLTDAYSSVFEAFSKIPLDSRKEGKGIVQYQIEMRKGNLMRGDAVMGPRIFDYRSVWQDTMEVCP